MSKLDAQRAMREAKYARRNAGAPAPRAAARPPVAPPAEASTKASKPAKTAASAEPAAAPMSDTCGHKSMNGRACTRPAGHAEKSHRYA